MKKGKGEHTATESAEGELHIRKAAVGDAGVIQQTVNRMAEEGSLLPLSLSEIYDRLRDFAVAERGGMVAGVCALHVVWEDLGEIRSLAVDLSSRDRGIGRALVEQCLDEARSLRLRKVFALTYQPEFFRHMGFRPVDKGELPHKVWRDCIQCTKFPDCDEVAVLKDLDEQA